LLCASIYAPPGGVSVVAWFSPCTLLTENNTPELALRIRVRALPPPGAFDEFNLSHFKAGQLYTVPSRLASLLILAGYAELVDSQPPRAEAADFGHRRFRKRK
jgi:hypothetical protein